MRPMGIKLSTVGLPRDAWYNVVGRGSGQRLAGFHQAHVDRPYGEMQTFCGVGVSSAIVVSIHGREVACCRVCKRESVRLCTMQSEMK
jgi:hypothetical protein